MVSSRQAFLLIVLKCRFLNSIIPVFSRTLRIVTGLLLGFMARSLILMRHIFVLVNIPVVLVAIILAFPTKTCPVLAVITLRVPLVVTLSLREAIRYLFIAPLSGTSLIALFLPRKRKGVLTRALPRVYTEKEARPYISFPLTWSLLCPLGIGLFGNIV